MLTRCGFTVATAPGGQETIASYQQAMKDGTPFDAVIMDLTIPGGMGGKEAIVEILAIDPAARAFVSSGYANDPIMVNCTAYGFTGVIAKPFDVAAVQHLLDSL
jgi:CheY-like chemotaxis protein